MLARRDCVIRLSVTYLLLLAFFFAFREKENLEYFCRFNAECVRFCCVDKYNCNNKFIKANFNESLLSKYDDDYDQKDEKDLKFIYGKPNCRIEPVHPNADWEFNSFGGIIEGYNNYNSDEYCLEARNKVSGICLFANRIMFFANTYIYAVSGALIWKQD